MYMTSHVARIKTFSLCTPQSMIPVLVVYPLRARTQASPHSMRQPDPLTHPMCCSPVGLFVRPLLTPGTSFALHQSRDLSVLIQLVHNALMLVHHGNCEDDCYRRKGLFFLRAMGVCCRFTTLLKEKHSMSDRN